MAGRTQGSAQQPPSKSGKSALMEKASSAKKGKIKPSVAVETGTDEEEGDLNENAHDEEEEDDDDDDDDEQDDGVSEEEESGDDEEVSQEGLEALMKALGDDGLSAEDLAQLQALRGEAIEDDDAYDDDGDEEDEDDKEEEEDENDEDDEDEGELEGAEEEVEEVENHVAPPRAKASKSKASDTLAASLARSGLIPEPESEGEEEEGAESYDEDEAEEDDEEADETQSSSKAAAKKGKGEWPAVREKINNQDAMRRIRQDLSIDGGALGRSAPKALPWIEHMTVVYPQRIDAALAGVPDPANDDLKRELAFYKQALDAAIRGRRLCNQAGIPFDRPADFYAEQVKTDEHMERVRQRLLDESAGIKASEEAKRQRELKKFGKKVQVEKQLERQKSKRELNERIKGLKRKHEGALEGDDDDFDVRLETAIDGQERGRGPPSRGGRGQTRPKARMPRSARDAKYGFGGKKKHAKENTRESTNDFGAMRGGRAGRASARGGRGGRGGARGGARGGFRGGAAAKRPGKSRRTG